MANSEHSLRIKAILDTQQVQSELQKLRAQQQQMLGGGARAQGVTASGQANLAGLNSTLGRLNQTMVQLQQAIRQLTAKVGGQQAAQASQAGGNQGAVAAIGGLKTLSSINVRSSIDQMIKSEFSNVVSIASGQIVDDKVKRDLNKKLGKLVNEWNLGKQGKSIGVPQIIRGPIVNGIQTYPNLDTAWDPATMAKRDTAIQTYNKAISGADTAQSRQMRKMMRMFIGQMALGQVGGAAQQWAANSGNTSLANGIAGAVNIGQGAVMGGMAFGPWGAVGGGVLGAVETALDLLGQSAKEAAAAVQEWAGLVKNAAAIDKSYTKTMFQESVPGMSVMQLDTEIAARERTRADSKYGIQGILNKWNVSSLEALAERGESLQRSINDNEQPAYIIDSLKNELEYVKSDLQTANELWSQYTESTNELTMLQSQLKSIEEDNLAAAKERAEATQKSRDIEKQRQQRLEALQAGIAGERTSLTQEMAGRENLFRMRWGGMSLDEINSESYVYGNKAKRGMRAYDQALEFASKAQTPEEKEAWMREAQQAKGEWQFNESQSQAFAMEAVNRLQEQLASLVAPSMTQVNSLAGIGLMTSKSDDEIRLKQQTDYLSQQVQLQREIRDRVREMDNDARYQ